MTSLAAMTAVDTTSMCGILGIVGSPSEPVGLSHDQILRMRDSMTARGPDDAGFCRRRNIAFAHRRLSIRDIEGGAQPWVSDDGQTVLVYNGEIYNDRSLRKQLAARGEMFRSRCDTEVVMAAYRQWGPQCVERLSGMFAFGIYDFRDDRLLLARDRFGIKPLFLTQVDGSLVFASSIGALLTHPAIVKRPHFPAISHYLTTFRLTLGRETFFEGIWRLMPGETLLWQDGTIRIEQYWDYPADRDDSIEYADAVAQLEATLRTSVAERLVSDVPVGMFLSGGVDSSVIASLIGECTQQTLLGQCGGGEPGHSEDHATEDFAFARQCARLLGFEFGEVRVPPDEYLNCWLWMIEQYTTPLSTPTDVILFRLAQEMKKSVGVALGGEGADELFCGYAVQHWAGHEFDLCRRLKNGTASDAEDEVRFRRALVRQYGRDRFVSAVDHFLALNSLVPTSAKPALFQPWAWKECERDSRLWAYYSSVFDRYADKTTAEIHALIHHRVNLEGLLGRLDSATMLAGLEARVPYTDHVLVEQMMQLPGLFKIDVVGDARRELLTAVELEQRGVLRSKRILRSMAASRLPAPLARRKKASFPTPVAAWLSGPWAEWTADVLRNSEFGRAVFQPAALSQLAENVPQAGMWLWPLVNVLLWGDRIIGAQHSSSRSVVAELH